MLHGVADEQARLLIERRFPAAGVWEGIRRAGFAVAAQEVLDRSEADAEQVSDFDQGIFAALVGFDDAAAQIIRVWVHSFYVIHLEAKRNRNPL